MQGDWNWLLLLMLSLPTAVLKHSMFAPFTSSGAPANGALKLPLLSQSVGGFMFAAICFVLLSFLD